MKAIMHRALLGLFALAVGGCSGVNSPTAGGRFGNDVISMTESAAAAVAQPKNGVSIHLVPYRDGRKSMNPRKIGISTQNIIGISGSELMVEPEVAVIVTNSLGKHLDKAGFQVSATNALYELSGVVSELSYNVKARDEIDLVVESTLKERASGKVVWSGVVSEKGDRFAGVMGNSKQDIANYLRAKVGVVAGKTTESIAGSLMAGRPDLFILAQGAQPIAGVVLRVAPPANVMPASAEPCIPASVQPAAQGIMLITSLPPRAKIYINDVYYGLAPLRLELAAGVHSVRAVTAGRKAGTEKVAVRKGETTEIEMCVTC
jgi:PEGA domain